MLWHTSRGAVFSDRLSSLINWGVDRAGPFGRRRPDCRASAPTGRRVRRPDPSITSRSGPSQGLFLFRLIAVGLPAATRHNPPGFGPASLLAVTPFESLLAPPVLPERVSTAGARIVTLSLWVGIWVDRSLSGSVSFGRIEGGRAEPRTAAFLYPFLPSPWGIGRLGNLRTTLAEFTGRSRPFSFCLFLLVDFSYLHCTHSIA